MIDGILKEVRDLRERNDFLQDRLERAYERMGKLEKDIINTQTNLNIMKNEVKDTSNRLLSIDLLEEGRSYIGSRKRHTYSTYK